MGFINRSRATALSLCFILGMAVLTGCATSPKSASQVEDVLPEDIPDAIKDENFVALPNPYLQQKIDIPADLSAGFEQGMQWMQSESWPQAEVQFTELTAIHPTFSGPWVNLGICQWRLGRLDEAAASFESAISANSLNIEAYNTFAVMLREQGEFARAESLYKQAIQIWPHSPNSHRNLGILYDMYMGRFDDALYHFEIAAKVTQGGDKKLRGWIVDIKRRQAKAAREAKRNMPPPVDEPQPAGEMPPEGSGA